jgi:superfamily II RNA helicase
LSTHSAAIVGIITADFTIFPRARVIITVPQILEKMLFDMQQTRELRLGYVVLDEIHFIQEEDGQIWCDFFFSLLLILRMNGDCRF